MADYRQQFAQALQNYGKVKDPIQEQYEAELMKPAQVNQHKSEIALIDNLTGSNFSSQLPKEEKMKDKLAQMLQMRQGQEAQRLSGLGKLAGMQNQQEAQSAQRAFQEKLYGLKLMQARNKAGAPGQPRKHGSEDIKIINNIDSMLSDIPKLKAALARGEKIMPEIMGVQIGGDNEASAARKRIKEWFGRNQSGGAIGTQEAKDFYEIISSVTDTDEMKEQKLDNLFNDVKRRRDAFYYGPSANPAGGAPANGGMVDPSSIDEEAELDAQIAALNQQLSGA